MMQDRRVRASVISMAGNVVLVAIQVFVSWLSGSLAVAADALHSLSDLGVSSVVLLGILLRRRHEARGPSADPTRLHRLEAGIAYAVSLLILYSAYEIARVLLSRPAQPLKHLGVTVVGVLACILVTSFLSKLKLMVGRETGSAALVADGYHSRTDMLSSVAVLGVVMGDAVGVRLDVTVAGLIAALVVATGLELLVSATRALLTGTALRTDGLETWVHQRVDRAVASLPAGAGGRLPRPRRVAGVVVAGVAAVGLLSGLHVVEANQVGVRTRLGAVVDPALGPGLHLTLPWPLERVALARPGQVEAVEVGFRQGAAAGEARPDPEEALVLLGDESLVEVKLVVHYRVRSAVAALHRARSISETVRGLTEANLRGALCTERADDVLTGDRARVTARVRQGLQRDLDSLGLDVDIVAVLVTEAAPPPEVASSFRDVFSAREDQLRLLEQALAHQNQALPAARARGVAQLSDAEAEAEGLRARALGDAERFRLTALAQRDTRAVTGTRLFLETVEAGLAGKRKVIVNPRANHGGYHLWLFAPDRPPAATPAPAAPWAPPVEKPQ
jgi:membrane protease subunit HflK